MDQNKIKIKHFRGDVGLGSETLMVVKLPDPKTLRVVSRSVFLALVFITFPCIGSFSKALSAGSNENPDFGLGFDFDQFDSLLRGLAEEGLLRRSDRALVVCPGIKTAGRGGLGGSVSVSVSAMDSSAANPILPGERFDLVYAEDLARDAELVDRLVKKPGGIVAFPLSDEYAGMVKGRTGYKIVYLRRYSSTIVAMRNMEEKEEEEEEAKPFTTRRLLLQSPPTEALKDLEEALLEPPRQPRRRGCSRKIKFLPELLGDDSLGGFGRRVFVNVGSLQQGRGVARWFDRNYPKMRQEFEVYGVEGGVSEWLARNVREEEYVVMKAEAEVVEEMVSDGTIHLVDELFLECNNEWWRVGKSKSESESESESKRAYWECLALYGRVKDEGVAVHQWWGFE